MKKRFAKGKGGLNRNRQAQPQCPMDRNVKLSIIIVSYNTADQIGRCLTSLATAACCPQEITVVDNASTDGGADFVGRHFPTVHLIANEKNQGFARANNQALAFSVGRYVLFLNPDTAVHQEALHEMITFMECQPTIALAGPKIVNPDGSLQESVSYRYPGQRCTKKELDGLKGNIACVLGAAMVARRDCVAGIGGFDEDFFLYGEDQDLCLRLRKAGHEIGYIPQALVMHLGAQSERGTSDLDLWRKKTRAEYLFYRKHYAPSTVARIADRELLKARFRLAVLNLAGTFSAGRKKRRAKIAKYRSIIEEIGS